MTTALIKMEQIEKGCLTMELYNYLLQQAFVLTLAFHQDRQIGEEREEQTSKGEEDENIGLCLSVGCSSRKEEVICDDVNDDANL